MELSRSVDVWLYPSIIWEVAGDSITRSPSHSLGRYDGEQGLSLRFPRFIREREDKEIPNYVNWEAAIYRQNLKDLFEGEFGTEASEIVRFYKELHKQ
jgi:DNA ligase-1